MTEENPAPTGSISTDSHPAAETGSIRDRVQRLRQKASQLSETLDRVEENLQEAAGETTE